MARILVKAWWQLTVETAVPLPPAPQLAPNVLGRFLISAVPYLQSHRIAAFFKNATDQTNGAGHHPEAAANLPGQAEFRSLPMAPVALIGSWRLNSFSALAAQLHQPDVRTSQETVGSCHRK